MKFADSVYFHLFISSPIFNDLFVVNAMLELEKVKKCKLKLQNRYNKAKRNETLIVKRLRNLIVVI